MAHSKFKQFSYRTADVTGYRHNLGSTVDSFQARNKESLKSSLHISVQFYKADDAFSLLQEFSTSLNFNSISRTLPRISSFTFASGTASTIPGVVKS